MNIKNPAHPSAILRECLDDTGWSISEFADKLRINTDALRNCLTVIAEFTPKLPWP